MAAAAKTRPALEPASSHRGRGAAWVTLTAVQRDEDQPQVHDELQTAIYINAFIMLCCFGEREKHEIRGAGKSSGSTIGRLVTWKHEAAFEVFMFDFAALKKPLIYMNVLSDVAPSVVKNRKKHSRETCMERQLAANVFWCLMFDSVHVHCFYFPCRNKKNQMGSYAWE